MFFELTIINIELHRQQIANEILWNWNWFHSKMAMFERYSAMMSCWAHCKVPFNQSYTTELLQFEICWQCQQSLPNTALNPRNIASSNDCLWILFVCLPFFFSFCVSHCCWRLPCSRRSQKVCRLKYIFFWNFSDFLASKWAITRKKHEAFGGIFTYGSPPRVE